ncbi:C39 family peptidase [Rhodococcus sp. NPDC049939]|uniref:C39 family peptidase n=1 Tax=Rhodococcus sp. NPDC049939 TaxID=3155511 RepID=UPI00340A6B55
MDDTISDLEDRNAALWGPGSDLGEAPLSPGFFDEPSPDLPEDTFSDVPSDDAAPLAPASDLPAAPSEPDLSAMPAPEPEPELAPYSEPETDPDDGVSGNPEQWTTNWFFQELDGYCGPSSAAQLVSEYTGLDITDPQQLMDRAMALGLMANDDPSQGMTLPNLEILLEDQGVPSHIENSSLDDLKSKLEDGYGVIAMVDSGEIWTPTGETVEDDLPDHFLVVAGIDEARGVVILSDPGSPNGNQLEVPIAQFEGAWQDSGYQMLVADEIDPDLAPRETTPDPTAMALDHRPWAMLPL